MRVLTTDLAFEMGPQGIRCNSIVPSCFANEMATILTKVPEFTSFVSGRTPMQRWGEQDETVGVAIFLPSQSTSYINGTVIFVDGGMSRKV